MTWILHFQMNHSTISTQFGLGKSHSVDWRHCYGPKNLNLNTHLEIIEYTCTSSEQRPVSWTHRFIIPVRLGQQKLGNEPRLPA